MSLVVIFLKTSLKRNAHIYFTPLEPDCSTLKLSNVYFKNRFSSFKKKKKLLPFLRNQKVPDSLKPRGATHPSTHSFCQNNIGKYVNRSLYFTRTSDCWEEREPETWLTVTVPGFPPVSRTPRLPRLSELKTARQVFFFIPFKHRKER